MQVLDNRLSAVFAFTGTCGVRDRLILAVNGAREQEDKGTRIANIKHPIKTPVVTVNLRQHGQNIQTVHSAAAGSSTAMHENETAVLG
jgi:hypothetical protein